MNRPPLFANHAALGAKLVDFAGWEMPIHYSGVVDEYQAVRTAAGLFDVSHMGRINVAGPGALSVLPRVTVNDVAKPDLPDSHYSMVCTEPRGNTDDAF